MVPLGYVLVLGAVAVTAVSASRVIAGLSSENKGMADSSAKAMSGFSNAPLVEGAQDSKKKEVYVQLARCNNLLLKTTQAILNKEKGADKHELLRGRERLINKVRGLTNELNQLQANPVAPSTGFSLLNSVAQFLPSLVGRA